MPRSRLDAAPLIRVQVRVRRLLPDPLGTGDEGYRFLQLAYHTPPAGPHFLAPLATLAPYLSAIAEAIATQQLYQVDWAEPARSGRSGLKDTRLEQLLLAIQARQIVAERPEPAGMLLLPGVRTVAGPDGRADGGVQSL